MSSEALPTNLRLCYHNIPYGIICQYKNAFSGKKITLPVLEIYVIYTGKRKNLPEEISLADEFWDGENKFIDFRAKMVYYSGDSNIINQYIMFSRIADECIDTLDTAHEAVEEIFRICQERDILSEFLAVREKELMKDMDDFLYNQELWFNLYVEEECQLARDEGHSAGLSEGHSAGLAEGRTAGLVEGEKAKAIEVVKSMLEDKMPIEKIAQYSSLPKSEVLSIAGTSEQ